MAKRRNTKVIEGLIILSVLIIAVIINLLIRIILFIYDVITIYTSKYKEKSGNGFFKTYFNLGYYGEFKLYRKIIKKFGKNNVFTNVYLYNENSDFTEIDVIALSGNGIYVFEVKNYSGYIYGSENGQYWTQVLNKYSKNKFYNPLRQNYAHVKAVEKLLNINEYDIIPIIVFSNRSILSKINVSYDKVILQTKNVNNFINKTFKYRNIIFSENNLKEFSMKLIERSNMPEEIKIKHIEQIRGIRNNSNFYQN